VSLAEAAASAVTLRANVSNIAPPGSELQPVNDHKAVAELCVIAGVDAEEARAAAREAVDAVGGQVETRANLHTERQLAATATPRLIVARASGQEIVGGTTEDLERWTVMIRNVGQAQAEVEGARVNLAPQQLTLEPIPAGPIEAGGQRLFEAEAPPAVLADAAAGMLPFPLSFTYSGPTGDRFNVQATIRGSDGGARWLVIEAERHKSAGPAPR
jgi:hypothetical protein